MKNWNKLEHHQKTACFVRSKIDYTNFSKVDTILLKDEKDFTDYDFMYLRKIGIINGVGPSYFPTWLRVIISALFSKVKEGFHDIGYFIGGSEEDKKYIDFGLLKYSFYSIILDIQEGLKIFKFTEINSLNIVLFIPFFILGMVYISIKCITLFIPFFAYLMVLAFGSKAFYYHNF